MFVRNSLLQTRYVTQSVVCVWQLASPHGSRMVFPYLLAHILGNLYLLQTIAELCADAHYYILLTLSIPPWKAKLHSSICPVRCAFTPWATRPLSFQFSFFRLDLLSESIQAGIQAGRQAANQSHSHCKGSGLKSNRMRLLTASIWQSQSVYVVPREREKQNKSNLNRHLKIGREAIIACLKMGKI